MLTQDRILEIFQGSGALLTGHFRLRSGLHSDRFLQTAVVLQHPEYASAIGAEIAARVKAHAAEIVIGPAVGGVLLAHEVARALGARAMFGEKNGDQMTLRQGFKIESRDRIVVVDDVLSTGGSVFKLANMIRRYGGQVVAAAFIVDRSTTPVDFGVPAISLAVINIPMYASDECPMCLQGIPLVEP